MKAFSFFLLLFMLAFTRGFSQGNGSATPGPEAKHNEPQKLEASVSRTEQAERDLLVPRKYQEQLAVEASKPVKYGPSASARKKYYSKKNLPAANITAKSAALAGVGKSRSFWR